MTYSIKAKDICSLIKFQLEFFLEINPDEHYAKTLLNLINLLKLSLESQVRKRHYLEHKQAFIDCFQSLHLTQNTVSIFEIDSPQSFELGLLYWGALQLLNTQYCTEAKDLLADLALDPVLKLRLLRVPQFLFSHLETYYKHQTDASRQEMRDNVMTIRGSWDSVIWQSVENMLLAWENQLSERAIQAIEIDFPDFEAKPNIVFETPSEDFLPNTIYLYHKNGFSLFSVLSYFGQKICDQVVTVDAEMVENDELIQKVLSQDKFASIQLNIDELELLRGMLVEDKTVFAKKFHEIHYLFLMLDYKMQVINDLLNQITRAIQFPQKLAKPLTELKQQFMFLQNIFHLQSRQITELQIVKEDWAQILKDNIEGLYQNHSRKLKNMQLSFALFKKKRTDVLGLIAYPIYKLCSSHYAFSANDFRLLGTGFLLTGFSISVLTPLICHATWLATQHLFLFNFALMSSVISLGLGVYIGIDFGLKYLSSRSHYDESLTLATTTQQLHHPQITSSL
jgi:hypothetical protein